MTGRRTPRATATQNRILDAAEHLLSDRGVEATSMRAVTAAARVNLAAVNYHFGSKEGLVVAVFARRLAPINAERLERLARIEQEGHPTIEALLRAFIEPLVRQAQAERGEELMRLIGRALYEPGAWLQQLFREQIHPVLEKYADVLHRCLPGISREDLYWRMHFAGGAMAYTLTHAERLEQISQGSCSAQDPEETVSRLVAFSAAGLRGDA